MSKEYLKNDEVVIMKFDTEWIYETILERIASNLGTFSNVRNTTGSEFHCNFFLDENGKINLTVCLTKQYDKQNELEKFSKTYEYKTLPLLYVDNEILRNYGRIKLPIIQCLEIIDKIGL